MDEYNSSLHCRAQRVKELLSDLGFLNKLVLIRDNSMLKKRRHAVLDLAPHQMSMFAQTGNLGMCTG